MYELEQFCKENNIPLTQNEYGLRVEVNGMILRRSGEPEEFLKDIRTVLASSQKPLNPPMAQ